MNFKIEYLNGSVKMTRSASQSNQVYRIPFDALVSSKCEFEINNPFIVYILFAHNPLGKDYIYVGKSKNGIFGRPRQHADKFRAEVCFILTQEYPNTFFNDGTIQYLEDQVNQKVAATHAFTNTTETTNKGTANPSDVADCKDYLEDAYKMLNTLGLNLDRICSAEEDIRKGHDPERKKKPELPEHSEEMKSGAFVKSAMTRLLAYKYLTEEKFLSLCTVRGSKDITRRNLPLFWKLEDGKGRKDYPQKDMDRYWASEFEYMGYRLLIFSQWYPDHSKRGNVPTKQDFINWYQTL